MTQPKICPPTLRPGSKIMVVGEAPGTTEIEKQQGFVGASGRVLDKALKLASIDRAKISLTNVMKKQPPGNDFGYFYKDASRTLPSVSLTVAKLDLATEIKAIKPNVVIALGDEALFALTGKRGITKWRGSILPSSLVNGVKVIPSLHPAWLLRGQFQHFWSLVNDLSRAQRQSLFPAIRPPQWTSLVLKDLREAKRFLASISSTEKWSLDIETRANHLACFSIAAGSRAACFPIQNPGGTQWLAGHELMLWKEVQKLMSRNPFLVGQNLVFDLDFLFDYGLEASGIWMDTMISHAVLYPELPKGLDFLAALYTEMPYYKSEGKITNPKVTTEDLWLYNNKDTITTLWCAQEIEKQLKQRKLWSVHEFVTEELGLALEMQRNRLPVDSEKMAELRGWMTEKTTEIDSQWLLAKLAGDKRPNVGSPKQMAEYLYGPSGLGLKAKTHMGKVSTDETSISELKAKYPHIKELDLILAERHLNKLNSSYLDVTLDDEGALGGSWCVHGTETGRWTSSKSIHGYGCNLQTLPKAVRWMVVPPTLPNP